MEQETAEVKEVKKYVQLYGRPSDAKAATALAISFAYEVLAILLININFRLLGWALHSLNQVRFFIQFHDMAHFSFFSSPRANVIFGKLIGIYTNFPFNAWRDGHNHHHKHFGNIDRLDLSQTILFTKKQYQEMKGPLKWLVRIFREPVVFFLVTTPFVWFIGLFYTVGKRYGVFSMTFLEKVLAFAFLTWIGPLIGIPAFEAWLSFYFASILGTILFHLQHSVNVPYRARQSKWNFTRAALEGSTFLEVPMLLRPFSNGIEYHHIHHLNTNVPSYSIQECHELFDGKGRKWDDFSINRVDLELALKSMWNVMLDEEQGVLIPFDYKLI
jgi:omega-6 fatty acid desaturase (delta-12 desaturase)